MSTGPSNNAAPGCTSLNMMSCEATSRIIAIATRLRTDSSALFKRFILWVLWNSSPERKGGFPARASFTPSRVPKKNRESGLQNETHAPWTRKAS